MTHFIKRYLNTFAILTHYLYKHFIFMVDECFIMAKMSFSYVVPSFTVTHWRSPQTLNYICPQKRFEGINFNIYDATAVESFYRNFNSKNIRLGPLLNNISELNWSITQTFSPVVWLLRQYLLKIQTARKASKMTMLKFLGHHLKENTRS